MFGQVYDNLSDFEVARVFGRKFTDAIFKLPVDKWQGPVHSGLGYHLVRIDSSTPSQQARLSDVRDKVRFEWTAEQRRNMDQALYHGLRQKYQITLPGESTQP
jgi:peptidyl-prolyl cis-trans isomerase C